MSEISIVGDSLTIRLDGEHDSRSIHKFLGRKGFRLRDFVWTSNNTNAQIIICAFCNFTRVATRWFASSCKLRDS